MQIAQKPQISRGIRHKLLALALLPAALVGCQTGEGTGALVGGGAGAAAGNLIAKATHGSRTAGTVIGGAVGAIGGAIAGKAHDDSVKNAEARGAAQAQGVAQAQQGNLQQIAQLSQQGVTDTVIINQIRTSGQVYTLSADEIGYLKRYGVSDVVITEMQATASRPPRVVYQEVPVARPVYVEPVPSGSVGFTYIHR